MKLCGQQYIHPDVGFFCLVTDVGVTTFGEGRGPGRGRSRGILSTWLELSEDFRPKSSRLEILSSRPEFTG